MLATTTPTMANQAADEARRDIRRVYGIIAIVDAARRVGRYTLGAKIGSGGSADVYEAEAEGADGFAKRLVIKRIRAELATEPRALDALRKEAMLAREFHHGNVATVFDYDEDDDGAPYIVMERVDGCSLRALLANLESRGARMPLADALFIGEQVADALHYLHRFAPESGAPVGLVHRDVKPENILLSRRGVVKLTDFGIAKPRSLPTETAPGFIKGTPRYLAPEQAAGRPLDGRVDIYALGTVLLELCEASEGEVPTEILDRATALAPRDRYPTAHALRSALETWRVERGLQFDPDRIAALVERAAPSRRKAKVVSLDAALGATANPGVAMAEAVAADPLPAARGRSALPRWPLLALPMLPILLGAIALASWPTQSAHSLASLPVPTPTAPHAPKPEPAPAPMPSPRPDPVVEAAPALQAPPEPAPAPTGELRINVLPYATVRIDGKRYGRTPVAATLRAGTHRVALENPQTGKTVRGTVVVSASRTTSIKTWDSLQ